MKKAPEILEYASLAESLAGSSCHPSEAHGIVCGVLSASSKKSVEWQKLILSSKGSKNQQQVLQRLWDITQQQLNEFAFEFNLLLPEDEANINTRTEALGLWCQGFLTGLKAANVPIEHQSKNELSETLDDIIEIANVSYGDITDSEEEESAYFELVEYVKLAVLMVFHELTQKHNPRADAMKGLH